MAQFTNQAQLSYNNTVVNSNVVVGEIVEVVSANKTAVVDTYTADYAPNKLTVVKRFDETTFGRDLMAEYIAAGGLS